MTNTLFEKLPANKRQKITQQIYAGRKTEAIKLYHEAIGCDLLAAKQAIEQIEKELRILMPDAFGKQPSRHTVIIQIVGVAVMGLAAFLVSQWLDKNLHSSPVETPIVKTAPADLAIKPPVETEKAIIPETVESTAQQSMGSILTHGEWDKAEHFDFNVLIPAIEGKVTRGTLYLWNDATNLYLAVKIVRPTLGQSSVSFDFDNDNDGEWPENGDGTLIINPDIDGKHSYDGVRTNAPPCPAGHEEGWCGSLDVDVGGSNDGVGVAKNNGEFTFYEFSHPLNSADNQHDFSLKAGDTIGYRMSITFCDNDCVETEIPGGYGFNKIHITPEGKAVFVNKSDSTTQTIDLKQANNVSQSTATTQGTSDNEEQSNANRRVNNQKQLRTAIEKARQDAKTNPVYLVSLAVLLDGLGNSLAYESPAEAEKLYREALAIRRPLAKKQPDIYAADLAQTLSSLAMVLNRDRRRNSETEGFYQEALLLERQLAAENPALYLEKLAYTLSGLVILISQTDIHNQRSNEAEKLYLEDIAAYRKLVKENPNQYGAFLTSMLSNYAQFLTRNHRLRDAEQLNQEMPALQKIQTK